MTLTYPTLSAALPAVGTRLRDYVEVELPTTDACSVSHVDLLVSVLDASSNVLVAAQAGYLQGQRNQFQVCGQGRGKFWLATKPFQIPAGTTPASITTTVTVHFGGNPLLYPGATTGANKPPQANPDATTPGPTFTVKLDKAILRTSTDPRPAWGL